jgi:hypothetical protein
VIAYPHIDDAKTSHAYWYARWTGNEWRRTWVQHAGHSFHQNWNRTERCYSGGMTLDPDNINDMYLSIPTKDGQFDKDGVYEIWQYTISDDGQVSDSKQITKNSEKNNSRPFVIPGSKNSPLRLAWMNGDYYYWMVQKNYPMGYPTNIRMDCQWQEKQTKKDRKVKTINKEVVMDAEAYAGVVLKKGNMTYAIDNDYYPVVTIGNKSYRSQNVLLVSDNWAQNSTGTTGDNHPTKLTTWNLTLTYDGKVLTCYRNGLVDQVIETKELTF